MRQISFILLFLFAFSPALSDDVESVVAKLSQTSVSLTTGFAGSKLSVYGAIKGGGDEDHNLQAIVTVTGPSAPLEVRKKVRTAGIWINGRGVRVESAPSFYAVATTGPIREIITHTDELRFRIGLDHVIQLVDAPNWVNDREEYRRAVARVRADEGLYSVRNDTVDLIDGALLLTEIDLPANLVEGDYEARIFLLRDMRVIDVFSDTIEVRRAGIGRIIYWGAREYPALYGVLSIVVALIAGWLASAFFRTFFPN